MGLSEAQQQMQPKNKKTLLILKWKLNQITFTCNQRSQLAEK